ncbi:hypothetical protein NFI96_015442 [Prochilodus magdalenae]|nr:hypothetical protein NFI96_015442 [Prochilodus magdalenae]
MIGQQILTAARLELTKENGCLIFILAGLIVVQSFVEKEFQCICRQGYREAIVYSNLGIPAFIFFTVTFCILRELKRQESDKKRKSVEKTQKQESNTEQQSICVLVLKSLIPSLFWMVLFLCDGRYVACVATTLKGENADSTAPSPWEWCNINRTLTDDQTKAQNAYFWSKIAGFAALFICSFFILLCECCKQPGAKKGTAGTQCSTVEYSTAVENIYTSLTKLFSSEAAGGIPLNSGSYQERRS